MTLLKRHWTLDCIIIPSHQRDVSDAQMTYNILSFLQLDLQVPTGWQSAISLDSLNSSHPVSQDVQKASEIDELFDTISYNKVSKASMLNPAGTLS